MNYDDDFNEVMWDMIKTEKENKTKYKHYKIKCEWCKKYVLQLKNKHSKYCDECNEKMGLK